MFHLIFFKAKVFASLISTLKISLHEHIFMTVSHFYRLALKAIFNHCFTLVDLKSAQIFTRIFFSLLRQMFAVWLETRQKPLKI